MAKYKVAEIAIELKEDGTPIYWGFNAGWHPGQGGMEWAYGNYGVETLETLFILMKKKLKEAEPTLLKDIKERVENDPRTDNETE